MRVVLIDPWTKTVTEADMPPGIEAIYAFLTSRGEKLVDDFNVVQVAQHVSLYVDGEGFLKPNQPVWHILGYSTANRPLPLAGKGILFGGVDAEGNDVGLPAYISRQFCEDAVTFTNKLSTGKLEDTVEAPGYIKIGAPILKYSL